MLMSPRRVSTPAALLRLMALCMAAVLLLQSGAAAAARGAGPLHVHQGGHDPWPRGHPAHHDHDHDSDHDHSHEHRHGHAERHHHAAADASVMRTPGDAADDIDTAALALAASVALPGAQAGCPAPHTGRHVWRAAPAWPFLTSNLAILLKPPRRG